MVAEGATVRFAGDPGQGSENAQEQKIQSQDVKLENAILPPPFSLKHDLVENLSPGIPGELFLDSEGKLLRYYLQYQDFMKYSIDAYDHYLINILPKQLQTFRYRMQTAYVRLDNITYESPTILDRHEKKIPLIPQMCRLNDMSYMLSVYADFVWEPFDKTIKPRVASGCFVGRIPLMLKSRKCYLYGKSDRELLALSECVYDPGSFFVIQGSERFIIQSDKLRSNKYLLFFDNKLKMVNCQITFYTLRGPKKIQVIVGKYNQLELHLPFFGKNGEKLINIDLFQGFRLLGNTDLDKVIAMILDLLEPQNRKKAKAFLEISKHSTQSIADDVEYIANLKNMTKVEDKERKILQYFEDEMFPIVNFPRDIKYQNFVKSLMLAKMSAIVLEYLIGVRQLDDIDSWANKRINTPAKTMEQLVTAWIYHISEGSGVNNKTIQNKVASKTTLEEFKSEFNTFSNDLENTFQKSFTSCNWGTAGSKYKENVTDSLKRESLATTYSQLTQVNAQTSGHSTVTEIRMVNSAQAGYICGIQSPEGERSGLVKNLAITAFPTIDVDDTYLRERLRATKFDPELGFNQVQGEALVSPLVTLVNGEYVLNRAQPNIFWLNGIPRGVCYKERGNGFVKMLKLTNTLPYTGVIMRNQGVDVYMDAGRPIRPLLTVNPETLQLVMLEKGLDPEKNQDLIRKNEYIPKLMQEGALEYIDADEQDSYAIVAQWRTQLDSLRKDIQDIEEEIKITDPLNTEHIKLLTNKLEKMNRSRYTHCEIDPIALWGIVASLGPFSNYSQGPRNSFQCNMTKQSLTIYHSNHMNRVDTTAKTLAFPTRPMFETETSDLLGMSDNPNGQTVKVAIMTYTGYNIEDGFIFKRSSIDNGLFTTVKYMTITDVENTRNGEIFGIPKLDRPELMKRYEHLQENGLPAIGSVLSFGQIVIAKKVVKDGKESDDSKKIGIGEEGIVDKIYVSKNGTKNKIIRVKIRQIRRPQIGDKFSSRYAQKGTIGLILDDEDMPFIESGPNKGTQPDIIISPFCLTGDTLVSLGNGNSKRIKDFEIKGGEDVWCYDEEKKGCIVSKSLGMEPKGEREILQITMEDGRKIRCTPDHKILSVRKGEEPKWVEAKDLVPRAGFDIKEQNGEKYGEWNGEKDKNPSQLFVGPEFPEDIVGDDEKGWEYHLYDDIYLRMNTKENRDKTLAFARLLGFLLTDGTISKKKDGKEISAGAFIGHLLDMDLILKDVRLFSPNEVKYWENELCYAFKFPLVLKKMFASLKGMTFGRRTRQPTEWPEIVKLESTPKSFMREFLGGLFGGDGHAPYLEKACNKKDKSKLTYLLQELGFSNSIIPEFRESMQQKIYDLGKMLSRFGIEVRYSNTYQTNLKKIAEAEEKEILEDFNKIYAAEEHQDDFSESDDEGLTSLQKVDKHKSVLDKNNTVSYALHFLSGSSLIFQDTIGFRYCIQKIAKLNAAASFWRLGNNVKRQHDLTVERVNENFLKIGKLDYALLMAQETLILEEAPLNDHYSLSSMGDIRNRRSKNKVQDLTTFNYNYIRDALSYFKDLGCDHWFLNPNSKKNRADYINTRKQLYISDIKLSVLAIRPAGKAEVFDIGVDRCHNFLASGITVHNCIPSRMTCGKLIEIIASKVGALKGERVNATAYRQVNHGDIYRTLRDYGFNPNGNEVMISGFTGERITAEIYSGPAYYNALGKDVIDKTQVRNIGNIDPTTHEPIRGRTNIGGSSTRVGEMESGAFITHATPSILRERLNFSSDGFRQIFCRNCGTIAMNKIVDQTFYCTKCKRKGDFGKATIPTSFKYLIHLLGGANAQVTLGVREANEAYL